MTPLEWIFVVGVCLWLVGMAVWVAGVLIFHYVVRPFRIVRDVGRDYDDSGHRLP